MTKMINSLYTDIYLVSVINPSSATIISCRHADNFLNIGDNVFINELINTKERQDIHRKMSAFENKILVATIGNRLAFIITDSSSTLNCFIAIFPRLPSKATFSLIKDNRLGDFDIFKSTQNELYEYHSPYNYMAGEIYQILNKLFSQISLYRNTDATLFRSYRNCTLNSEYMMQTIVTIAEFTGCKLYIKESNFKPSSLMDLNFRSLCDYTFCVFLLARRLSETHSTTLHFNETSGFLTFAFTIDCYTPPNLDPISSIKFVSDNCPELIHCKKSSTFNNCVFNYKIEHKNDKTKLVIETSTYVSIDNNIRLKAST